MGGNEWHHMGSEKGITMEVKGYPMECDGKVQRGQVMKRLKWEVMGVSGMGWEVTGALRWNVKEGLKWEVMGSDMEMKKNVKRNTQGR